MVEYVHRRGTDKQTDRRTEWNQYIRPPPQILKYFINKRKCALLNPVSRPLIILRWICPFGIFSGDLTTKTYFDYYNVKIEIMMSGTLIYTWTALSKVITTILRHSFISQVDEHVPHQHFLKILWKFYLLDLKCWPSSTVSLFCLNCSQLLRTFSSIISNAYTCRLWFTTSFLVKLSVIFFIFKVHYIYIYIYTCVYICILYIYNYI